MEIILFDSDVRHRLLPFTHTRPVADIRCGIMTMRERWEYFFNQSSSSLTEAYLQPVFPQSAGSDNLYIDGAVFANADLFEAIQQLQPGQRLISSGKTLAFRSKDAISDRNSLESNIQNFEKEQYSDPIYSLEQVWDIFSQNDRAIKEDFDLITSGRDSVQLPDGVIEIGTDIFIEKGAIISAGCIINAITGPVYIGKDAEIMEGTMIRGPFAMCDHSVVKMGAKIYGATTLGPGCKVGGEISNAVFFANSNKAHDGFLGNAVIGEWCNLGADTNCSNLKNNYDEVKIWDEHENKTIKTGLTFCGLLMGDHSKAGINTMFNTGTVVGVSCNVFGGGFPQVFIPSFSWGGSEGLTTYKPDRAMETADRMMARRHKQLSEAERNMLQYIFDHTVIQRDVFAQGLKFTKS